VPVRVNVIYTRYSSDRQRQDSRADQEREVRAVLPRHDIDPTVAAVIRDEAESGTRSGRGGFERLCAMIARGEVGARATDDRSRLSRADNVYQFVQDLVYAGGRFVSTGEGIDTAQPGWAAAG
jgi:DNA invertase Pin-like site-specific DNA recombinase